MPVAVAKIATPAPATPATSATPSQIDTLKQQGPNISAWVTSPLDTVVPDAIWQNLTFMKEELRDEAARKPAGSTVAYGTALRLCALMLDDLAARKVAQTEAGGAAALHQTSQLTDWRRDHLTCPCIPSNTTNAATASNGPRKTAPACSPGKSGPMTCATS